MIPVCHFQNSTSQSWLDVTAVSSGKHGPRVVNQCKEILTHFSGTTLNDYENFNITFLKILYLIILISSRLCFLIRKSNIHLF